MAVHAALKLLITQENVARLQRREPALTIQMLAELTGLATSTITGLTTGRANRIDFRTIDTLCRFFQVQPGALLVWTPEDEDAANASDGV